MNWKYSEDKKHIVLDKKPTRFKYLTGTRFASALGLNPYSSPFQIWCECTKLVTPPFEETIYIKAGRVIEPLQREYVAKKFPNIVSPEEYFGEVFEQVRWNFFRDDQKPFAGCWDAVSTKDNKRDIMMVVEFKTASDPRRWDNTIPIYYELQGALYAKLLGLDRVLFVASFLDKLDYAHPEKFIPNEVNTILVAIILNDIVVELNGEYLSIDGIIEKAKEFWETYIETGVSPEFDEQKDKQYLDIIRTSQPINDTALEDLCDRASEIENEIAKLYADSGIESLEKELKTIKENIKKGLIDSLKEGELKASCKQYKLSGTISTKFDDKLFQKEHPKTYDKYCKETTTFKLTKVKEEELGDDL